MTEKELIIKLRMIASDISNKSPLLLLCDASIIFKRDNKEIVYDNNGIYNMNGILIINLSIFKDFSLLSKCNLPIVFLSDNDNLSLDFMSSIKTIVKFTKPSKSKLINSKEALQILKEGENNIIKSNFYATESPELYYYKNKFSMNKYIDLFSSD